MPKIRVHELAKQLNVSSKDIIEKLGVEGESTRKHMLSLESADVERITKELSPGGNASAAHKPGPVARLSPNEKTTPDPSPSTNVGKEGHSERPVNPAEARQANPSQEQPVQRKPRPLGPDGKPLPPVGPDGRPLQRKPRPLGPDGKPLPPLGPDGRPLQRKPRPLGPDGRPLPPVGPDGRPLQRKPRPLGEDGRPLPPLGPDGRPLQRKPRPIGEDGRPLGLDGRPLQRKPRPVGEDGRPLGPDGRPLQRKPRPLGEDGRPLPQLGPDGRPLQRKPRPIGEDGKPIPPVGPDGKPLQRKLRPLGEDGKPIPPVGPDGRPLQRKPRPLGDGQPPAAGNTKPVSAPSTEVTQQTPANTIETKITETPVTVSDSPAKADTAVEARPRPDGDANARPREPRPASDSRTRPQGEGRPRQDGTRPSYGDRPPRQDGFRSPGGPRPGMAGGGGRGPAPGGPPRPGAPRGGPASGRPDAKKGEPTKDDRKSQWGRSAQARTTQRDKNERSKEGSQNQSRGGRTNRGPKPAPVKKIMPKMPVVTEIKIAPEISIRDLAEKLHRSNADVIKVLMRKGVMVTANQVIDFETASFVAESFDVLVEEYIEVDAFEAAFAEEAESDENMQSRPPVVVVMGHVDHGKTSLLDVIRSENVQASEAGGITQHIGAYSTSINGKAITFLDTPGHEAFTAMRMRGAQVTDIAILVVAADDGVMPQTIEAINHAKAAGIEIIVAINKMDKPGANPDRVKQELVEHGLQSEDWGGETITVPVSALQRTGIEQLLEMILLVSEMKELKANPDKSARGSIIEAKLDKGRGPVATVLVQSGTLKIGDPVVAGACFGKVRAMTDSRGRSLKEAGPSTPVEIIGLAEVPVTGDILYTAQSDKQARQLAETVVAKSRVNMIKSTQGKVSLDDLFNQIQAGQVKDLNIVVKADVQGSVEALRGSLDKLTNPEVRVRIIHTGVGAINETDVMLASASNAIIIGFNVRPDVSAKSIAEAEHVDIRTYSVIYSAIDDIEAAMKGMLDPEFQEKILGHAEIRQVFKASSVGNIAGCYINDGKITRNAQVRLIRDGRVIYDGYLEALKRFKDDAREVAAGYECGMLFRNYSDIKEGDRIEAYIMEEIPR